MHFLYDAIACGFLAALTWMGLVWMSPSRPIESGKGWVQGVGIVAIANTLVWIALASLNLRLLPLWIIMFLLVNAAIARLLFPLCEGIKIPKSKKMSEIHSPFAFELCVAVETIPIYFYSGSRVALTA